MTALVNSREEGKWKFYLSQIDFSFATSIFSEG